MTRPRTDAPELIEDKKLDEASGGVLIGMLLPAVQKVRAIDPTNPNLSASPQLVVSAGPGAGPH